MLPVEFKRLPPRYFVPQVSLASFMAKRMQSIAMPKQQVLKASPLFRKKRQQVITFDSTRR